MALFDFLSLKRKPTKKAGQTPADLTSFIGARGLPKPPSPTPIFPPKPVVPSVITPPTPKIEPPVIPPPEVEPIEPPKLTGDDFEMAFKRISGVEGLEEAETRLEEAKVTEERAFFEKQKAGKLLIESSQKMFDEFFNSPEIQAAREDRSQAFAELKRLDAEEIQATQSLRESIRAKGTPSWAAAGQLRIVSEGFAAQKSSFAASFAIANERLDNAKEFAEEAYDHNTNILQMKMDLVQGTLDRATTLNERERADFEDILTRAKTAIDERKEQKDEATDLFLSLSNKGVRGLSADMSIDQMTKAAGSELVRLAEEERAEKLRGTVAEQKAAAKGEAIAQARPELERSRGDDGYVDPSVYMRLRSDYAEVIGDVSEFDDVFSPMLSPKERARLGIGKVVKPPSGRTV